MLDFFKVTVKTPRNGPIEVYPTFLMKESKDLMIRGKDFYAVWVEDEKHWSTSEQVCLDLIDDEIDKFMKENEMKFMNQDVIVKHMWNADTGMIDKWHKYVQKQCRDNYHMLDETLIFKDTELTRDLYSSKHLDYSLRPGDYSDYDELMDVIYDPTERLKLEWAIGSVINGDSKKIQKFLVLYGAAGTGKSTILNIIMQLFKGYYCVFDAKALGSNNGTFALEPFKVNPLVAIQHDGDLSKIEDNTRLNSLVSHEEMTVNEKFKSTYTSAFKCFLFLGSNKPVKITDAKSGLMRRLIDVKPSGRKVEKDRYEEIMAKIPFELGAIAWHCKEVYEANKKYFDDYQPLDMLGATNDFYNFVQDEFWFFDGKKNVTLSESWQLYTEYCSNAKVPYGLSMRAFKEELKNYFDDYVEAELNPDGTRTLALYKGFLTDKFDGTMTHIKNKKSDEIKTDVSWLDLKEQHSKLDDVLADCIAQYSAEYEPGQEQPAKAWDKVTTKLKELDTSKLHYALPPKNLITVDFDIPDPITGKKSFELNKVAASKFPPTYAETSKSGQGIHLEYWYTGDPDELDDHVDEHVEIKVFRGKAALRRLASKCNDLDISTIDSGLPIKVRRKKDVVDENYIQTVNSLRRSIERNLRKEIAKDTTTSCDFIAKDLQKAYDSGLSYNLDDLHSIATEFAFNSTNQASKCLKKIANAPWHSKDFDGAVPQEVEAVPDTPAILEKPIAFYDIECFPNLFLICYKLQTPNNDGQKVFMLNPKPEEVDKFIRQYRLIGYNNRKYDNHMIRAAAMGASLEELYQRSQTIISHDKSSSDGLIRDAYNLSYTDIYDFASSQNKMSLKKLEIKMGIHHMELGLPWDKPVPDDMIPKVIEYCGYDVDATEAAFYFLKADWIAREILAELAGGSVNETTNNLTKKIIFGSEWKPQAQFKWREIDKPVRTLAPDMEAFLKEACPQMMSHLHGEENSLLPYFPEYHMTREKDGIHNWYKDRDVGKGGEVYAEPGIYFAVALLDIVSMHPHSTIAECLFGVKFTTAFRNLVEGRVDIKHEDWEEISRRMNGKLDKFVARVKAGELSSKDLANGLKTAINAVYGQTSAKYENAFRDPKNVNNIVALRGALFMNRLREAVQARGFTVAHIKTDSIKIPNATPEIIKFCMDMAQDYGYTFEHEATYERMCLVNDAVYIARYAEEDWCMDKYGYVPGDNKKEPGAWTATGKQFKIPCVFKKLFTHEEIKYEDLCVTQETKSALYLDMNEKLSDVSGYEKELDKLMTKIKKVSDMPIPDEMTAKVNELTEKIETGHNRIFIGKVGLFSPMLPGAGGGILLRDAGNGSFAAAPDSDGYRWMEAENVIMLKRQDKVDYRYFDDLCNDAINTINQFGDFYEFIDEQCEMSLCA